MCHMSSVMCRVSCAVCHVPCVMCRVSCAVGSSTTPTSCPCLEPATSLPTLSSSPSSCPLARSTTCCTEKQVQGRVCVCVCVLVCVFVCVCLCACVYMSVVYVCVYECVWGGGRLWRARIHNRHLFKSKPHFD